MITGAWTPGGRGPDGEPGLIPAAAGVAHPVRATENAATTIVTAAKVIITVLTAITVKVRRMRGQSRRHHPGCGRTFPLPIKHLRSLAVAFPQPHTPHAGVLFVEGKRGNGVNEPTRTQQSACHPFAQVAPRVAAPTPCSPGGAGHSAGALAIRVNMET